jgi:hypothetical protein
MTIDDDLAARLDERARSERLSVREVLDTILRQALVGPAPPDRFVVRVQESALQPGVDPLRLNQLADELEDEAHIARTPR